MNDNNSSDTLISIEPLDGANPFNGQATAHSSAETGRSVENLPSLASEPSEFAHSKAGT